MYISTSYIFHLLEVLRSTRKKWRQFAVNMVTRPLPFAVRCPTSKREVCQRASLPAGVSTLPQRLPHHQQFAADPPALTLLRTSALRCFVIRFAAISEFMTTFTLDPAVLATQFAVTPGPSAAVPVNAAVAAALDRTQTELFSIISAFGTIEAWLQLALPPVEDGNNFGVSIVMEAKKMVADEKKALAVRAHRASPDPLRRAWRDI